MARFVLCHGAFAGAWCWEPVIGPLEQAGHTVSAFDLPGSGADQTAVSAVTLEACAARVCAALLETDEPAILVAHSMGGVVATQAYSRCPEQIALLVYLTAFLPRDGQSLLDLTQLPEGAGDQVQANIKIEGDPPVASLSAEATRHSLYNLCTDEQFAWAVERRRPQAVAPFATPISLAGVVAEPSKRAYIHCLQDHAIPLALQRRMVAESPCASVLELNSDHAPFLCRTAELVRQLDGLAA
jgi:pimeloyl-ACP methyl ester carboxylesterase